jgi:hypothetical protein
MSFKRHGAATDMALAAAMMVACVLGACEATSMAGPAGRRARMVDEQLQAVLERDFPVGTSRAAVRAKAAELGMEPVAGGGTAVGAAAVGEDAGKAAGDEEEYSFSFAPGTSWEITRSVRVRFGADGRAERAVLVPRMGGEPEPMPGDEPAGGWIHVEGER